jgi:STE24 endopeptidase
VRSGPTSPAAGHPQRARDPRAIAGAALAGIALALVALRLGAWGIDAPSTAPVRLDDWFDPAAIDANRDYRRGVWIMGAPAVLLTPAVAVAAALTGERWRPPLVRAARGRPWRAGLIAGVAAALVLGVVSLPLAAGRFAWGRSHGVILQDTADWLTDVGRALAVSVVILGALGCLAAVLLARFPRTWWVALAGVASALALVMAAVAPVVVEPLFQRTEPLRDPVLRDEVIDLAARAGVSVDDVRINDAATRTTAANAHVSGLGSTRRIVLYDTLVREFPADQVRVVVAHELAHVEARHIPKGIAWVVGLSLPVCLLLFAVVRRRTGTAAPGRDAAGCDLVVRRLAVLAAGAAIVGAASVPLQNAVSRSFEREAEVRALELTGDPAASIALQQGLVARARAVPDPPAIVRLLFGTHPTALERIAIARAWEDARDGTP